MQQPSGVGGVLFLPILGPSPDLIRFSWHRRPALSRQTCHHEKERHGEVLCCSATLWFDGVAEQERETAGRRQDGSKSGQPWRGGTETRVFHATAKAEKCLQQHGTREMVAPGGTHPHSGALYVPMPLSLTGLPSDLRLPPSPSPPPPSRFFAFCASCFRFWGRSPPCGETKRALV